MDVEAIVERWRGPLTGLLASWGAPWADAAELAQDALAEAYLSRERFRGDADDPESFGPWLRGIAFRVHRSFRRRREQRAAAPLDAVDEPAAEVAGEQDELARLRAAIDRLPGELATVVRMRYLDEARVRDVAALLGVSEKTVEGRLYRARRELRRLLDAGAAGADAGGRRAR